jgi:hypothetical protein
LIKTQNTNNIIIYSNNSKDEKINSLEAEIFCIKNFNNKNSESYSWNLNLIIEVFDTKLFALEKVFKLACNKISVLIKNIWIFSNSQAAIQRLQNLDLKADQKFVLAIKD